MTPDVSAARLEGTWARHLIAHAVELRSSDPSWGSRWFPLADGHVVLQGAGLYVNRALAVGLLGPVARADLDVLEHAATQMGLPAAIDVGPETDATVVTQLRGAGYQPSGETSVMSIDLATASAIESGPSVIVRVIEPAELRTWQQVCCDGWGHDTQERRRASDAYATAAYRSPGEQLLLAFDAVDGRPLGCASLVRRDGLATLGGMSTVPSERGRGVQRALVAERLRLVRASDCDVAATSAVVGGPSERNLLRLGFQHRYRKSTWVRPLKRA